MIEPCAAGARQGARSTSNSTSPRSGRWRQCLMNMRTGSTAGSISITTSRLRSISIRYRSGCCGNRWTHASRRRQWRSSTAASWWRRMRAASARIARPRSPITCRVRTGVIATGRMNGSSEIEPRSGLMLDRRRHRRVSRDHPALASASGAGVSFLHRHSWTGEAL